MNSVGSGLQGDATIPNDFGNYGKDTSYKTLLNYKTRQFNVRLWPQKFWKSCANGSNIVAPRFGDHGTKEMLGVVGSK